MSKALILACALALPAAWADSASPSAAPAVARQEHLRPARDLAAAGRDAARAGQAMLVLFSEQGCPYCERLRRDFLLPMQRNDGYRRKLVFVEVDVHSGAEARDFSGARVSHAELARRYRIKLVPTVLLLGPGGEPLAEPLVGYNGPDFYGAYLDARIDAALAKLR